MKSFAIVGFVVLMGSFAVGCSGSEVSDEGDSVEINDNAVSTQTNCTGKYCDGPTPNVVCTGNLCDGPTENVATTTAVSTSR